MKSKINRMDPDIPFLSNKVKGDLKVDTPDGVQMAEGLGPYTDNPEPPERMMGARSGMGKRISVV